MLHRDARPDPSGDRVLPSAARAERRHAASRSLQTPNPTRRQPPTPPISRSPPINPSRPPPISSPSSRPASPIVSSGWKKSSADSPSCPPRPTRAGQSCCAKRSPKAASRTSTPASNRSSSSCKTSASRPPRPIKPNCKKNSTRSSACLLKADRDKELSSQRERIRITSKKSTASSACKKASAPAPKAATS